jgi:preprotein translocase subunit SecA/nephrocystin-3
MALELHRKALNIRCKFLGDNHPDTANSYTNIGYTYGELGDYKKALEYQQKGLAICRTLLGDDHPDTATSYNNIGYTYGELGDGKKDLEYQQMALGIRRALLGDDHPDTINSLFNLGVTYYQLGKFQIAMDVLQKVHRIERNAHPDSPMLKKIQNSLNVLRSKTKGFKGVPRKKMHR